MDELKKLLLLDNRHSADSFDIQRVARKRGWETRRTNMYQVNEHCVGYDFVRYYGNTLHAAQIKKGVPFEFRRIPAFLDSPSLLPYTKRKIKTLWYYQLKQPIEEDCFIKPVFDKWFEAKIYRKGESIIDDHVHINDLIYASEITALTHEVRCFCLDGELLTSSYYRINSIPWDATNEAPENINFDNKLKDTPLRKYVKEIYQNYPHLPRGAVLDFALTDKGDWIFVEANEAWASGLYYCDYDKCFDSIIQSVTDFNNKQGKT